MTNRKTKTDCLLAALPVLAITLFFFAGAVAQKGANTPDASSAVYGVFTSFTVLLVASFVSFNLNDKTLGKEWNCNWRNVLAGCICALQIILIVVPITYICKLIWLKLGLEIPTQTTFALLSGQSPIFLKILLCAQAVILAPFVEELAYRGVLHSLCKKLLPGSWAAIASGLYFAAMHANIFAFVPLATVGFFFARVHDRTHSLCAAFTAHTIFNAASLIVFAAG